MKLRLPSSLPPVTTRFGEGVGYADQLKAAGVAVDHHHAPSPCHEFCSLTDRISATAAVFEALTEDFSGRLS